MGRPARGAVATTLALVALLAIAPAASAWYGPAVDISPSSATPDATVTVDGQSYGHHDPVSARLDGLDGPILATFTPKSGKFHGPLVVPADIKPGNHVIVFVQYDATGAIEEIPTRALLVVTSAGAGSPLLATPVAVDTSARRTGLVIQRAHSLGMGTLVLVALGAAAAAALVAGIVVVVARRAGGRLGRAEA